MVCPRESIGDYQDEPITHFVSLLDPDEVGKQLPEPRNANERLQLVFSDLDDIEMKLPRFRKYDPPTTDHVSQLVDFGRHLATLEDFELLAHCEAGISRSTAAAIAILTAAGYPPQIAFGLVRRICPEMLPNRRILRLADAQLETGGRLYQMAETHRRKAFARAGYEDPTNVLYAEFVADKERRKTVFGRLLSFLPSGWRKVVGTGRRMRKIMGAAAASNEKAVPETHRIPSSPSGRIA